VVLFILKYYELQDVKDKYTYSFKRLLNPLGMWWWMWTESTVVDYFLYKCSRSRRETK